ncbi:DOMON-like domain-containing protein [Propionivibrio sp.]|uniref:DOMON-like domain-containing protein n=1 Tax=Propionivibrio sp. TaxID=2212460 RepID=UPI003BF2CD77
MQADENSFDYPLTLLCHPATPAPVVRTIEACASIRPDGCLAVAFRLWADMVRLLIPTTQAADRTVMALIGTPSNESPARPPHPRPLSQRARGSSRVAGATFTVTDALWEHTCFEAFVGVAGDPAYREFNFSPSGQWATYAFSGYRQPDQAATPITAPTITSRLFAGRLELEAIIPRDALPTRSGTLQIGLSAVVEAADTVDGSHSYWALRHPARHPDFHHRDAFTLELADPRNSV